MRLLRALREARYLLELALLWPLATVVRRAPEGGALALARLAARLAHRLLTGDRRWAERNLQLVYGDTLSRRRRRAIVRACFEHIALTRVEALRYSEPWMRARVVVEGGAQARAVASGARARGVGVIAVTAHLGNFELLPAVCHADGWPCSVLYRPQDNWRVEQLIAGPRADYLRGRTVPRGPGALLELSQRLRRGESIGLLIDINTLDDPCFVDVLGVPAASPRGAAALALATGAPVLVAAAYRLPDGRHRLVFEPPLQLTDTGRRRADIDVNTAALQRALERHILAAPEQYNWPHPRWRLRPDGSRWTLATPLRAMEAERVRPRDEVLPPTC